MKSGLTEKQKKILSFIKSFISENGFPPTLREIGRHFNITSTFGVKRHLDALKKKGYLNISSNFSRGISLNKSLYDSSEKIITISKEVKQIPIVGRVAAGSPILSEENIDGFVSIDNAFIKNAEGCFALRVQGDSMIDAGIYEGDMVIVKPQNYAISGDIVVARLETEITVKVFDNNNREVFLLPKNEKYSPINITNNEELFIVGKVVGVLRWYN
jgi:repressor LexA